MLQALSALSGAVQIFNAIVCSSPFSVFIIPLKTEAKAPRPRQSDWPFRSNISLLIPASRPSSNPKRPTDLWSQKLHPTSVHRCLLRHFLTVFPPKVVHTTICLSASISSGIRVSICFNYRAASLSWSLTKFMSAASSFVTQLKYSVDASLMKAHLFSS